MEASPFSKRKRYRSGTDLANLRQNNGEVCGLCCGRPQNSRCDFEIGNSHNAVGEADEFDIGQAIDDRAAIHSRTFDLYE